MRSCSSSVVLVQDPTEQVISVHRTGPTVTDDPESGGRGWRLQPQRRVRTMGVGVGAIDPEDLFQVTSPDDQEPVGTLGADRAYPPLRMGVRVGAWTGVSSTSASSERNTSSKLRVNFASRSWRHPGQVDPSRLQFDEEQHVQPLEPHRVDGEVVAGDDPSGLLAQEPRQVVDPRRGAGSSPWRRSLARIPVAETRMPRRSSSPWMRW